MAQVMASDFVHDYVIDEGSAIAAPSVNKLQVIENLKHQLKKQLSPGLGNLPFSLVEGGIPKGALVHIHGPSGTGKTYLTAQFLAENPSSRVAWIEDDFSLYP